MSRAFSIMRRADRRQTLTAGIQVKESLGSALFGNVALATISLTITSAVAVGEAVLVGVGYSGGAATANSLSFTDTKGNFYVTGMVGQRSNTNWGGTGCSIVTTRLEVGDVITAQLPSAFTYTRRSIQARRATGIASAWPDNASGVNGPSAQANYQPVIVDSYVPGSLFWGNESAGSAAYTSWTPVVGNSDLQVASGTDAGGAYAQTNVAYWATLNTPGNYTVGGTGATSTGSPIRTSRGAVYRPIGAPPPAGPAVRDVTVAGSSNSTFTVNRPSLAVAGDTLLLSIAVRTTSSTPPATVTAGTGWTVVAQVRRSTSGWLSLFTRTALADDPSTFTVGGGSGASTHIAQITAVRATSGVDQVATYQSGAANATQPIPVISATVNNTLEFAFATGAYTGITTQDYSWPAPATELLDTFYGPSSSSSILGSATVPGRPVGSSSSTITATCTTGSAHATARVGFKPMLV